MSILPTGIKSTINHPNCLQNFTFAFTLNMVGILVACLHKFPYAEKHAPALALGNFVASVACRNEFFLRYLFWTVVKIFQKVCQALLSFILANDGGY